VRRHLNAVLGIDSSLLCPWSFDIRKFYLSLTETQKEVFHKDPIAILWKEEIRVAPQRYEKYLARRR